MGKSTARGVRLQQHNNANEQPEQAGWLSPLCLCPSRHNQEQSAGEPAVPRQLLLKDAWQLYTDKCGPGQRAARHAKAHDAHLRPDRLACLEW